MNLVFPLAGLDAVHASVRYSSTGNTLIIGPAERAHAAAERLSENLLVSVLVTDGVAAPALPGQRRYPVFSGQDIKIEGWLGDFHVGWRSAEPREPVVRLAVELILDLSDAPLITARQTPKGYYWPGPSAEAQEAALQELPQMTGEFEKPVYFRYKEKLCAHGRNGQIGCTKCIDICSAEAIISAGDNIQVNANLCAGCGACSTVCPTGAMAYDFPPAAQLGDGLRKVIADYIELYGAAPQLRFHAPGTLTFPDPVIAIELQHIASVGMEVWLAAIAYGAAGISVVANGDEAPAYIVALEEQMDTAQTILSGLGYAGRHLALTRMPDADSVSGETPSTRAGFNLADDKRTTLSLALDHLFRYAPAPQEQIALPRGAPFGAVLVDTQACTLCMSCVGACPKSALLDTPGAPELRFIETNCVQCGLCETTCPEEAIKLQPRMSFAPGAKTAVVLNRTEPFCCIRCNKPFGTLKLIETMLQKLGTHSAFRDHPDRLRMCGDCRVIDMMQGERVEK
jgi:ferredoxin